MKNFFQENDEAAKIAAFYGFSNNGLIVEGSIAEPTRQDVTLTVTHNGDAAGIEFSLDNVIWEPYPAAGVVVTDNCTVYFRGFDESGNQISAAEYEVKNIDRIIPEKPEAAADITEVTNKPVTVTAVFSADSVRCEYNKNDLGWQEYPAEGVRFLENGVICFRSFDAAGNVSETAVFKVENIDIVPPEKPQCSADITQPVNRSVTVYCDFSDDSVICEYRKDGGVWLPYPADGVVCEDNALVEFRSYDAAGNVSETARYRVENIDKKPPEKPVISVNREYNISNDPVILVAAAREGVLEYSFDSDNWYGYTGPVAVTENKTVYVRTTDEAGNSTVVEKTITNIDPVAESSVAEYIFIKSSYTWENTFGKSYNGVELKYGTNAFASLKAAKDSLADHGDKKYVFLMLDNKTTISGLVGSFNGRKISGNQQKVKLESDADFYDYSIKVSSGKTLDIVSGDYSGTVVEWFNQVKLSGRAEVAAAVGGKYNFTWKTSENTDKQGRFVTTEQMSRSFSSGGKLAADSFARAGKIEYFKSVALDNAVAGLLTGGSLSEKQKAKYVCADAFLQKNISESSKWSTSGTLLLKNVAEVQRITGFKNLTVTNASVGTAVGGSGKYSGSEKATYTAEKVTRSVTSGETWSASGKLVAKGSLFNDIFAVNTVNLTDSKVSGVVQNYGEESFNGTCKEKLSVSTDKKGSVNSRYEISNTYKRTGSFTATAKNDMMTVGSVMYYNEVVLNRAEAGAVINQLQTLKQETYQQLWENAADYGIPDDWAIGMDMEEADLIKAQYKYSAAGSVTMKNGAVAQTVKDYKNVKITDSSVIGDIELGDCVNISYKAKIEYAQNGTKNKKEEKVTQYSNSGSVKLSDSSVGGNITGYNKVIMDNSRAGNISRNMLAKSVEITVNGIADVNNSYVTEKLSGSVTLKNNSVAGDISNYSKVEINESRAGNLRNISKLTVGKGYSSVVSFTGTSGNDTLTIKKGAVFSVTDGLNFGAGNKDKLVVDGTMVLYTADVTNLEKISGKGDIAVTDKIADILQLDFENFLNLGATVENFRGSTAEQSDNTARNALKWDGAEELCGWLGKDVDCEDTIDFITLRTEEACMLKIGSSAWLDGSTDIVAVNNVILNITDGGAQIALSAHSEYTIKLERKESNSAAYTITLA